MPDVPVLIDGHLHRITPVTIDVPDNPVIGDFSRRFFSFGSCFARRTAEVLRNLGFCTFHQTEVCSHWTSRTLLNLLEAWERGSEYAEEDLYHYPGSSTVLSLFHAHLFGKRENAAASTLAEMKRLDEAVQERLKEVDVVLLTLANATYLRHPKSSRILCYNRAVSPSDWTMVFSSCEEICDELEGIYRLLKKFAGDDFWLVLSVSPQRYAWENLGIVHDSLDKAKLRVAMDQFIARHPGARIECFPGFEIVVDELRSCEVFSKDGTHVIIPHTANYVVNRFLASHCTPQVRDALVFSREHLSWKLDQELRRNELAAIEPYVKSVVAELKTHYANTRCEGLLQKAAGILRAHGADHYADELADCETSTRPI